MMPEAIIMSIYCLEYPMCVFLPHRFLQSLMITDPATRNRTPPISENNIHCKTKQNKQFSAEITNLIFIVANFYSTINLLLLLLWSLFYCYERFIIYVLIVYGLCIQSLGYNLTVPQRRLVAIVDLQKAGLFCK